VFAGHLLASPWIALIAGQTLRVCPEENRFPLFRIMLYEAIALDCLDTATDGHPSARVNKYSA
jgi:hypothetical protein